MPTTILIDIETAPRGWDRPGDPGSLFELAMETAKLEAETGEPPKNYKRAEAIEKWRSEQLEKVPERAMELYHAHSLKGETCQIVTLVAKVYGPGGTLPEVFHFPNDERDLLERFRAWMGNIVSECPARPWVVAWHGSRFDFPVLAARLVANGLPQLASHFWSSLRYGDERQLGLRPGVFRLVDAAQLYPRPSGDRTRLREYDRPEWLELDPLHGDGGLVLPALLAGKDDDVRKHCVVDVEYRLTQVWDRLWPMLEARGAA